MVVLSAIYTQLYAHTISVMISYNYYSHTQFHLLHIRSMLTWEPVPQQTQSVTMTAPQYTIIGEKLYFGGGNTDNDKQAERVAIFEVDVTNTDSPIRRIDPNCPLLQFGLGNIGGKLTAVGGLNHDDKKLSNNVFVLEGSEWIPVASLLKPRARVCVISQTENESCVAIAACGGRVVDQSTGKEVSSNLVEVYHCSNQKWVEVTALPRARAALRATCLHGRAYLLGGWMDITDQSDKDCFSIVTKNLFAENGRKVWKELKELPSSSSTPAHLCGTLLALGGVVNGKSPVLAFNPNMQEWNIIGKLPKTISSATAATLPNGKLIVFGGWEKFKTLRNEDIFIGQVTGRMF